MPKSKSVALTTKAECIAKDYKGKKKPFAMCGYISGPSDCDRYHKHLKVTKNNLERTKQCKLDFPGVIEMRGRG